MKRIAARVSFFVSCALAAACPGDRPQGLMASPVGTGPRIMWDLDAKPVPEVPLPNDMVTRTDPSSPTGRRINVSLDAPTQLERDVRKHASQMDGFGTYAPISLRFEGKLDLDEIVRRQRGNKDYADDVVLLLNLQPGSRSFGKLYPLDFGHGNFPLVVAEPNRYWVNDPFADVENLIFDTHDEDANGNGLLDPGEDKDDDGWLDKPNVHPLGGHPVDDLLTFYERATDTLIVRPILPLEQESLHAVVVTKHLRGENGQPVRSPFPYINHSRQTAVLADLPRALAMNGFKLADVAFAWAFTTQGTTRDLEALRRGIYGNGVFSRLAKEFPPDVTIKQAVTDNPAEPHLMTRTKLLSFAQTTLPLLLSNNAPGVRATMDSLQNIDYVVHGEFSAPNLLADKNGIAEPGYPADDDEVWEMNRKTGEAFYRPQKINFWCTIPRKERGNGPPFPVAFYSHGHTSSRFDMIGLAGFLARYGIAHCGIAAYGHGLAVPPEYQGTADLLINGLGIKPLFDALTPDRARDLDNDGVVDSGVDFWTGDLFHLRDMVRQTVFDYMVFIRNVRAFDGVRRMPQDLYATGTAPLAGDFNNDGIVDLGGPLNDYFMWGHSLGGIMSAVLSGIEPAFTATAPICYAAGLTDVGQRTARYGVPNTVILPTVGPIFVGEPGETAGSVTVSAIARRMTDADKKAVGKLEGVEPGDKIRIVNLVNHEQYVDHARADLRFRLHIPADALDATTKRKLLKLVTSPKPATPPTAPDTTVLGDKLRIEVYRGANGPLKTSLETFGVDVDFEGVRYAKGKPLVALAKGLGLQRNTPRLRRMLGAFAQMFVEPADPINYAPHYFADPLPTSDYDPTQPGAAVLLMPTLGDPGVSISTGIAGARAAGLIDIFNPDPRYGKTVNEVLIDNYIVEGLSRMRRHNGRELLMDPEDLSHGQWAPDAPRLDPPLRLTKATGQGIQALRMPMLDPRGQHCFAIPEPEKNFDNNAFLLNLIGRFFQSKGRDLRDNDLCMATQSCDWMPRDSAP